MCPAVSSEEEDDLLEKGGVKDMFPIEDFLPSLRVVVETNGLNARRLSAAGGWIVDLLGRELLW